MVLRAAGIDSYIQSPRMAAPQTFVALCGALKIPHELTKSKITRFLQDAGVTPPTTTALPHLKELAAAITWTRNSLSNGGDPDTWTNDVGPAGIDLLKSLYPLPPAVKTGESDAARAARVISLFAAVGSIPTQPQPTPLIQPGAATTVNTSRSSTSTAPPPSNPTLPLQPATVTAPSPSKRKAHVMMHDDLKELLDDAVYRALDAFAFHPVKEKERVMNMCKTPQGAAFFNNTVTAPFGHQISLSLTEGEFFEAPKRGLALAVAGRSAAQPGSQSSTFGHGLSALNAFQELRKRWVDITAAASAPFELSGSHVDSLWLGVMTIMDLRAERSALWNVPEVHAACKKQRQDLLSYRSAIVSAMAQFADPSSPAITAKSINTAYIQLFLPFWWEHILGKARLDETGAAKEVKDIMAGPTATPAPPPPPTPPPAPTPQLMPFYYPPAPPPPGYMHVPPPAGWPHPPVHSPKPPQAQQRRRFLGKPLSPLIIGTTLGTATTSRLAKRCACVISTRFPGRDHFSFECPLVYHAQYGTCPGWTAGGDRVPGAWAGDDITPLCRNEWRTFAAALPVAEAAAGVVVPF